MSSPPIHGRRRSRDMLQQMDAPYGERQWQGYTREVTQHPVQIRGRTFIVEEASWELTSYEAELERRSRLMTSSRPESNHSSKRARVSASGDAILALDEVKAGDAGTPPECAVCLVDFVAEDRLRAMPCSHTFHQDCIFRWLRINHVCPLCRHELPTQQHENEDEDENYLLDYLEQEYQRYYGDGVDQQYSAEQIYEQESLPVPEDNDGNYQQDDDDGNSQQESTPVPEDARPSTNKIMV